MKTTRINKLILIVMVLSISYALGVYPPMFQWGAMRYCYADVNIPPNAGTTSATFLKYGVGSRAVSMGNAFSGLADDITAMYWNPAGLAQLTNKEFSLTHNESFQGIRDDFAGYAFPYKNGVLGIAAYGLYTPNDLERRSGINENDPYFPVSSIEGYFGAYDVAGHLTYARYFKENLSFGASLKIIQQNIDTYSAYGAAVDLGAFYKFKKLPLSLGLSVENIGPPIKFISQAYDLPLNIRFGSAYKFNNKLTATLDLNQPNDNYLSFSTGLEYWPISLFAIRAGYLYNNDGLDHGNLYGFSAGVGFNIKMQNTLLKVDYAFVPNSLLGDSQRITVGMVFGSPKPAITLPITQVQNTSGAAPEQKAAQAPQLPSEQQIKIPLTTDQYNMYPVKINIRRRITRGRQLLFRLSGETDKSDIVHIDGSFTVTTRDFAMAIGEKAGEGAVYKHYIFQKSFNIPINNTTCRLRLPIKYLDPAIIAEDGSLIESVKVSEDNTYVYYNLTMDTFKPFRVESKSEQLLNSGSSGLKDIKDDLPVK